jgi:internalin A
MPTKPSNRDIVAILTEKIGTAPNEVVYFEDYVLNLSLSKLDLPQVPSEIWQLTQLQRLDLSGNRLSQLPPEIGKLTHLRVLTLDGNRLSQLPPEIGKLTHLWKLILSSNNLSLLPIEIWQLSDLQELYLRNNRLPYLHHDMGKLLNLQLLDLNYNRLSQLPPEIGQLSRLEKLYLNSNHLSHLPPEVGQLSNLQIFTLSRNQLKHLPTQIGKLNSLYKFELGDNPYLVTPPPEIIASGLADIKAFLQELQEHSTIRYETKLLVVGEGGTGKSSLLRSLREEMFNPHLSTTHGIEVGSLELPHPNQPQLLMTLNTWDFGGQQIYHATHQFFLTRRSLYLVVWNARLGADQGRLNHWLDTIKALAPDAPVLLVATHIDERAPDLNYQLYKTAYPQLVGQISVSNRTGAGIAELKAVLADNASQLPLMGQPWPQTWLNAETVLLDRPEHHIDADIYTKCCSACGVKANIAKGTLGNYLHDLGKILYFRDDYVLSNLVVLKPNWVTKAISRVLTDEATSTAKGILSHSNLPRIWATDDEGQPYELYLYPVFLRLMERFDLSYQIESDIPGDHPIHSLIPQLLPHQPPVNLPSWPKSPAKGQSQVEMVYRFDFVPAGILSWFIVRTHRYTQNLHWREGVLLTYEGHQPGQGRTQPHAKGASADSTRSVATKLLYHPQEHNRSDFGSL